ncbi:MAG: PQQ-binding-like beta-propeller repeat protein [Gemmatimonadetes bacterium]|nr:PQQ-binding-like beta-propeller repeat protein [Gemmatimonadota bacterium]
MLLVILLAIAACEDGTGPGDVALTFTPADTTLFSGDSLAIDLSVASGSDPASAANAEWTVSDSSVLGVRALAGGAARVRARARGTAYVIATVEDRFVDSARVRVVEFGDARWRVPRLAPHGTTAPALDGQGRVYSGLFRDSTFMALSSEGTPIFSVSSTWSYLSPAVMAEGTSYTEGRTLQRHAADGGLDWNVDYAYTWVGHGLAVDADGTVVCLDPGGGPALLRISTAGAELSRTSLGSGAMRASNWASAPVIAADGAVYVTWSQSDPSPMAPRLSRISAAGELRWTVPAPSPARYTTPAVFEDRILITYFDSGIVAFDSTGTQLWDRSLPWGASSPVIDAEGNVYVQSQGGVRSFTPDGTLRWDSDAYLRPRGFSPTTAPTLLADGTLLVPCQYDVPSGDERRQTLCRVDMADGSLVWRRSEGDFITGSIAVAPDGTIYLSEDGDLVALWSRIPPLTEGWPTEGGGMGRLRRAR